jgi:hypothetical protein
MTKPVWTTPNPNSAVWHLDGTPYRVWAPQDTRTFVVERINSLGNPVPVKRGFRKLATAKAFAVKAGEYDLLIAQCEPPSTKSGSVVLID